MNYIARISMVLSVMLVLIAGTVLQYHHHGDVSVCMCFNPAEHCKCHHHHHDANEGTCACNGHEAEGSHDDASGCSMHLDYGVADSQIITPQPDMVAIPDNRVESDITNITFEITTDGSCEKTIEGNRSIWFLRGPPMC